MTHHLDLIRSAYTGMVWPALPAGPGALALALQFQLKRSQWEAPEKLRRLQFRQLGVLLKHAHDTVPFYRERLAGAGFHPVGAVTEESFGALPVLTRAEAQVAGETLYSREVPAAHMPVMSGQTSGSTGIPLGIVPVRQIQVVQKSRELIEARVVTLGALEPAEERALIEALRKSLGQPYQIEVARVQEIPRSSSGKYEDFIRDPGVH